MVIRIITKNGTSLGIITKKGIDMGPYKFDSIQEHKKFIHFMYDIVDDPKIMYGNTEYMSYSQARDIGDVLYQVQRVNSSNIDMEIMKALRNLTEYDSVDISRRLIKIANDIRD